MKNNGLSQRRRGRRESHVAFVAVHWGDCSNARHAIPPDVDVLRTSGGKEKSLRVLCVLKLALWNIKRSAFNRAGGREMLLIL